MTQQHSDTSLHYSFCTKTTGFRTRCFLGQTPGSLWVVTTVPQPSTPPVACGGGDHLSTCMSRWCDWAAADGLHPSLRSSQTAAPVTQGKSIAAHATLSHRCNGMWAVVHDHENEELMRRRSSQWLRGKHYWSPHDDKKTHQSHYTSEHERFEQRFEYLNESWVMIKVELCSRQLKEM